MTANKFEFEPALKELEEITAWFESSETDLDKGLAKFERGMELAAQLKNHLSEVENKIEIVKQKFSAGVVSAVSTGAAENGVADEPSLF